MKTPSTLLATSSLGDPRALARRGVVVMLISVSAFTANTLLLNHISGAGRGVAPDVPLLFRAVIGIALALTIVRGRRPTRIAPVFRDRRLILRGLTGLLGTAAYYWTVPALGAGKSTLICNTYVIFAAVIAVLVLGEKLTAKRFFWMAASFAGIALLVGAFGGAAPDAATGAASPGSPDGEKGVLLPGLPGIGWPELVALGGAVLAAWSVVLVRQLTAEHSVGTIYLAQCVWILVPLSVLAGPDLVTLEPADWGFLASAAVAAGCGQLAMNEGYRCLAVSTGASLQMLWPVLTSLGGWLIFGERFAPVQLAGAVLILASVWRLSVARK